MTPAGVKAAPSDRSDPGRGDGSPRADPTRGCPPAPSHARVTPVTRSQPASQPLPPAGAKAPSREAIARTASGTSSGPAATGAGRRSLLPLLGVALLVALVFLLPGRDRGGRTGAGDLPDVPVTPLQLDEPPEWALQHGLDPVVRALDRLDWGGHESLQVTREALEPLAGRLAPELLSRLDAIGATDPVLGARYVELLGGEDLSDPRVLDELVRRALSFSSLEASAALRVLARCRDESSLNAVVSRRWDLDPEVARLAGDVLIERARRGDDAALGRVFDELEANLVMADVDAVRMLGDLPPGGRADEILRRVAELSGAALHVAAEVSLARHGDADALAELERLANDPDISLRTDIWRLAGEAGLVIGRGRWEESVRVGAYQEVVALFSVLVHAIDEAREEGPEALGLVERVASDPRASAKATALRLLYLRGHPLAVEETRRELSGGAGAQLGQVVDRVLEGPADLWPSMGQLALARLEAGGLRVADELTLMRFVAGAVPVAAADRVVDAALGRNASAELASGAADVLAGLGDTGLARLAGELGTPRADALFVLLAGELRSPAALEGLAAILADAEAPASIKQLALDALARVQGGPRVELLRSLLDNAAVDPALRERARLVFWNYL